jgi:hypothetical protein
LTVVAAGRAGILAFTVRGFPGLPGGRTGRSASDKRRATFEEAPMLPGIPPADPNKLVAPKDGHRQPDATLRPRAVGPLLATGRRLLRENPRLSEAEFRNLMLERFRASDQALQQDQANMTANPGHGAADGVFAIFLLPWTVFRWLGWRGRLARHHAEMGEVVRVLRGEGHFAT